MVLTNAMNRARDLVFDDVEKGQLGTDGTAATESDATLGSADATTLLTLTKKPLTDKQIKMDYLLPSTGGTTGTYREYEILGNSDATHYDRIVFTGISWTQNGTQDLNITKRYFFKSV